MEIKEIIDILRVCADDEIICPACPHYDTGVYGSGTAYCYQSLMLEAADTIESQQKRIAELDAALREQEQRRWIPVTERLPEESGDYIVYYSNTASNKPLISMRHFYGETPAAFLHNKAMTYWMPLPESPKEVE